MDKKFFKSMVDIENSNMIFQNHMSRTILLNISIVLMQLIICITGLYISLFLKYKVSKYTAILNLGLLIVIILNNIISNVMWKESKRNQAIIAAMNDLIEDKDLTLEEIYLHLSAIKNYKIEYSDERLRNLIYKWYKNIHIEKREKLKYKDSNGKNYHIGDIVVNECLGDMWLLVKLTKEEMKRLKYRLPYAFVLNGDDDEHMVPILEVSGFKIKYTPENTLYGYIQTLILFSKMYKMYNQSVGSWKNKNREDDLSGESKVEIEEFNK